MDSYSPEPAGRARPQANPKREARCNNSSSRERARRETRRIRPAKRTSQRCFEKTDRRGRRITLAFTEEGRIRVKREDETLRITGADEAERRLGYYASPEVRANPSYMAIGDVVLTPRERRTLTERFDEEKRKREQEAE